MSRHSREEAKKGDALKHVSHLSQGSTIAASSTLSAGESSFCLADFPFPQPPPSIPSSPLNPNFPSVSNSFMQSRHVARRTSSVPVRMLPPLPTQSQPPPYQAIPTPTKSIVTTVSTSLSSPDDWHDTASSLDVDAAEERLLPTSFVTTLLQHDTAVRASSGSDAISRISEITYPPINIPSSSSSRMPTRYTTHKPQGARPPPTAYNLRRETFQSTSSDAHTYVVSEHAFRNTEMRLPKEGGVNGDTTGLDPPPRPQSVGSTKYKTPSILSRLSSSRRSIKQIFANSRTKPLPPVPLIPDIPIATERAHRKADETAPLPELLVRADTLEDLLNRGYHPHRSLSSYDVITKSRHLTSNFDSNTEYAFHDSSANQKSRSAVDVAREWLDQDVTHRGRLSFTLKRRTILLICLLLVIILVAIVVGAVVGRQLHNNTCTDGMTGHDCDLNATCSCTSTDPRTCEGVAQSVLDLVPYLNVQFMLNKTNGDIYNSFWQTQTVSPSSCANQALLIDVAPALNSQSSPDLTRWARTAILWNFIESQDLAASQQLQNFVLDAPWNELGKNNGNDQPFSTNVSGFTFDFALQKVVAPAQSSSVIGQPSSDQDSRLDSAARSALDYIYENAVASSTQRHMVLVDYWESTLQRQPSDLQTFMTAVSKSPVVLSFDATTDPLSNLLSANPPATKFPPPLACYPGLPQSSVDLLNAVEHDIFNLPNIIPQTNFSLDCYPDHPVYGILDVLQLRLPPTGYPQQAAVLQPATAPRAAVYNGQFLSSPNATLNSTALTLAQLNPRRFGTLNHFEHVIFDYLNTMSTPLANATIDFVLGSMNTTHVPPSQNSDFLLSSIDHVPLIEVAVFGSVESSDIQWVESSFTKDSGALFFGSSSGSILRDWTVAGINSTLVWAQNTTAPEVVRDKNLTDNRFNDIWNTASLAMNVPNSINNLTQSLAAWGYFAP